MPKMKSLNFLMLSAVFVLGLLMGFLFSNLNENITGLVVSNSNGLESISQPSDYLNTSNILLYKDKITIKVQNASVSNYENTGSMLPFLTNNSNGLVIVPKVESEIKVGDIVSFEKENKTIVHRVVVVGKDENGTYFITKGDNSNQLDNAIRFQDIKHKLIGILY